MQRQYRIAYLLKTYPKLSETFILNEILGVEKLGAELEIFSLRRPAAEPSHPSVAQVKAKITYLPGRIERRATPPDACRILLAHLAVLAAHPLRYLRTVCECVSQPGDQWIKALHQAVPLARALQRGGFDHLHAHFANLPASVALLVHRLCGISYSFTAHAKDIYFTQPAELQKKMESAACVLTCTAYNQRYLASLATRRPAPIRLAYHGVDVSRFASANGGPHPQSETPLILSVGRFCEKKGFPFLIRACRILRDRGHRFECRIVGFGELEPDLRALIAELGVAGCVAISGKMTQDEVIRAYQAAAVFVLPCLVTADGDRDGIPNVLLEAMACRVPVVSTAISGITELIEPMVDGLLVAERDAESVAGAVETLLLQPQLRRRLGENGRAKVCSRFALEASALRVHGILSQAARKCRA